MSNRPMKVILKSVIATFAILSVSATAVHAQAGPTPNLYDGHLQAPDGSTVYLSPAQIDQWVGISSDGNVVMNGSSPAGLYLNFMWNGPEYNERINSNGQREAYIVDTGANEVRTEGMGYGLMIAVQANDQYRFNLLFNFLNNHMYFSSGQYAGFYEWHVHNDGSPVDSYQAIAPDGDEWIATALVMAQHRWGGNTYINRAWYSLYQMANNGQQMFTYGADVPNYAWNQATDASYVMPPFYQIWWRACGQNNSNYGPYIAATGDYNCWNTFTDKGRAFLNQSAKLSLQSSSGGWYEFHPGNSDNNGNVWNTLGNGGYNADAWRTPLYACLDTIWWGQMDTYWNFCRDRCDYYFWGNPRHYGFGAPGEEAMNVCATMAYDWSASNNEQGGFAQDLYNIWTNPSRRPGDYYNGYLYFLGTLAATGRFKNY